MYIVDVIKQKNKLLKSTIPNKLGLNGHTFPYVRPLSRFRGLKSLSSLALAFWGIGMMVAVFHIYGTCIVVLTQASNKLLYTPAS